MSVENLGIPMFQEDQEYILAVTKMLNSGGLPETTNGWYLKVQLADSTGTVFGEWSDEIASDTWSYSSYHVPVRDDKA